ncbi:protein-serine O-palmitoleoyltransferase porcupine-like [Rhopilema esculentum]|uniref:protein-serine O-palmitoleoyltransferase porcupine-like n=1 Tax=Rhopilema esculentum TaxID=499914 RepID=UPI0031DB6C59
MEHEFYEYDDVDDQAALSGQYHDSEAYYDDENELLQQLMQQEHHRIASEFSVWNECLWPTLSQGLQSLWLLLVLCLVLRLLWLLRLNQKLLHFFSFVFGFIALWHFYEQSTGYVMLLAMAGHICLSTNQTGRGGFLAFFSVVFMLSCEKFFVGEMEWNKIRGSVMIVAMKLISIGYGKKNSELLSLNAASYYGYVLNPASIIFGPFVTFSEYMQLFKPQPLTFNWFLNIVRTMVLSAVCLLWSTCGTTYVIPKLGSNIWIDAYKDANGFRFSNYFVSYTSELTCIAMGIIRIFPPDGVSTEKENKDVGDNCVVNDQNANDANCEKSESSLQQQEETQQSFIEWKYPVSKPISVEIPRSLGEVVTNWNLPMHYWLKNYVFKTSRHLGTFPAILLTYFASSLLHGLNFQLSVILLSIGVFAFIENSARKTLASAFGACIEARRCRKSCTHRYKQGNFWVTCANLAFGFIAVWNLAYLGCLFDNDPDVQDKGYSMSHALRKWAALGFICHYFMLAVFLLNKLIKDGTFFSLPRWLHSRKSVAHDPSPPVSAR